MLLGLTGAGYGHSYWLFFAPLSLFDGERNHRSPSICSLAPPLCGGTSSAEPLWFVFGKPVWTRKTTWVCSQKYEHQTSNIFKPLPMLPSGSRAPCCAWNQVSASKVLLVILMLFWVTCCDTGRYSDLNIWLSSGLASAQLNHDSVPHRSLRFIRVQNMPWNAVSLETSAPAKHGQTAVKFMQRVSQMPDSTGWVRQLVYLMSWTIWHTPLRTVTHQESNASGSSL